MPGGSARSASLSMSVDALRSTARLLRSRGHPREQRARRRRPRGRRGHARLLPQVDPPRGQGLVSRSSGRVGDSGSRTMCASVEGRSSSARPLGSERCALDSERRAASARTTGARSLRMVAISLSHIEANPASSGLAPAMRRRNCSGSTLRESSLRNARRFAAERSLASRSVTPPFWRPTATILHLDTERRTP